MWRDLATALDLGPDIPNFFEFSTDAEDLDYLTRDSTTNDFQAPHPKSRAGTANKLVADVPTRWNSSYYMFWRLLRLWETCDEFCKSPNFKMFSLLPVEWVYVEQMCKFLEPLSEATDMFCKSQYPTMHQVAPIYIVIIQKLKKVSDISLSKLSDESFFWYDYTLR